ncbi:MAG TPA: EAL domain-containing protein [Acidobacteriaceae bacterium]
MRPTSVQILRAIELNQFVPHFQPLVELHTGRLIGFEVLARWQHPEQGLVPPNDFIPLAEQKGMLNELMQQVVLKAFAAAVVIPAPLSLAINISPNQMHDASLPAQIRRASEETGFPLNRLTVEVTESALLQDLAVAQTIAAELKAMGCKLSLDDFGTGYSSLAHLQALPFDELKVDRSFVKNMTNTRESRKIVAAMIGLGHSLGLTTVGEGVETEEQAAMLLWLGCELGQGFLYSKPVSADGLEALVAAEARPIAAALTTPGDGWAVSSLEALPAQRLAQLQALYDGAPVGLCFLDTSQRYVSLNKKLAIMDGCSVAAHLGKTVQQVLPKFFPIVEPYLLRALQGEAMKDVELVRPVTRPGGSELTLLLSYQPAWDEGDEVIGVSIAVVDITEHKRMEEALCESNNRERHVMEQTHKIPWIMDASGNSIQVSSRWVPGSNLSKQKVRNLGWLEALHADDIVPTMQLMRQALHTGKPIDIEYRVKSIGGRWKWMRSRGLPRFNASGEITRWYGSLEDIDLRKRETTTSFVVMTSSNSELPIM